MGGRGKVVEYLRLVPRYLPVEPEGGHKNYYSRQSIAR
jgi:hypothetical protein